MIATAKMMKKVKGKNVIFSVVCLVLGFIVAYSYNITKTEQMKSELVNETWDREYGLRQQLINQEEKNLKLSEELRNKQAEVTAIEKELSREEQVFTNLEEDTEKYRMFLGKVKVHGSGVKVTLEDGTASQVGENLNDYLVHEQHVFKVINELYISGAQAVAVNGQRLSSQSYIVCNGPVITVDGQQHPAPFTITAIGDPDVLEASLNLTGGIKDQLVNENVVFTLQKLNQIEFAPILGS
jgi:uncharacterized protein YlxW (UPF0749 family)